MGRGSSKAGSITGGGGNVIAFPENRNNKLWDYRGEVDRTNNLITNAEKATSINQIQKAGVALRNHDKHLSTLIENEQSGNVDVKGDVNILMAQRRRVRQALKKLSGKF